MPLLWEVFFGKLEMLLFSILMRFDPDPYNGNLHVTQRPLSLIAFALAKCELADQPSARYRFSQHVRSVMVIERCITYNINAYTIMSQRAFLENCHS